MNFKIPHKNYPGHGVHTNMIYTPINILRAFVAITEITWDVKTYVSVEITQNKMR